MGGARRVFPILLFLLLGAPLASADPAPAPADHAAQEEARDAARREQQELRQRADALGEQQRTTEALLDKQEQVLRELRNQVEALKKQTAASS